MPVGGKNCEGRYQTEGVQRSSAGSSHCNRPRARDEVAAPVQREAHNKVDLVNVCRRCSPTWSVLAPAPAELVIVGRFMGRLGQCMVTTKMAEMPHIRVGRPDFSPVFRWKSYNSVESVAFRLIRRSRTPWQPPRRQKCPKIGKVTLIS
jgi:hypothetical protein